MGIRCTPPLKHLLIAGMALALSALCYADPADDPGSSTDAGPTTRPSHYGNGGAGLGGAGGGLFGDGRQRPGGPGGPGGRRFESFTPEEAAAAIDFFNKNSPNRMQYFNALSDPLARRLQTMKLVQAFRPLQNFKDSNPDLYNLLVQRVTLRDQAFALAKDGKEAELRAKANDIVDVTAKAQTLRLDLLQKELDEQKARLAADKANPDAAAEKEANDIKADEERLVRRADRHQGQFRQSMIDFDPTMDPLAEVAPILGELAPEGS